MKMYCFTIADGDMYHRHAEHLKRSLEAQGVNLTILPPGPATSREAKHRKITGILDAPRSCDRIIYLDADTFVLNADGMEKINGAWQIPWRIELEACLPKKLEPRESAERLESFYTRHGLSMFSKGGILEGTEWNSGVIAGDRDMMIELAKEWLVWWDRILELFDGNFRRDQLSFRIAYHNICLARNIAGLPADFNWIVSYFGMNPNVHILHRTMVRRCPWMDETWERIVTRKLAGKDVRTVNRCFDYTGIAGRPSLLRIIDGNPPRETRLLNQTLAFCNPNQVLICGGTPEDQRRLPSVLAHTPGCVCVDSLRDLPARLDPAAFDLILFRGIDYSIPPPQAVRFHPEAVFCFVGMHDLALYENLHEFQYVRLLDQGVGVFSNSPKVTTWNYQEIEPLANIPGSAV